MPHFGLLAICAVAQSAAAGSLGCFVEHAYSPTTKNMCEQQFQKFSTVANPAACADECVADSTCVMFAWETAVPPVGPPCRLSSTCKAPTNALLGWLGYFRNSTAGECAPHPTPSPPPAPSPGVPGNWSRVFLSDAAAKGAVCIDGSPGCVHCSNVAPF